MLILLRHGRTEANAAGLLLGRANPSLDDRGRAQARAAAASLGHVDRVIASPLLRTRQTAEALTEATDVDAQWVEMDYGEWDGRALRDIPAQVWSEWMTDTAFTPPGGESIATLGLRVRAACDALAEEAAIKDVVVVSHVSPIKAAVAWALGVPDDVAWHLHLEPASITRIATTGGRRVLRSFNATDHLTGDR